MNRQIPSHEELIALLEPLAAAPVECDGMTRLIATVLHREHIPFRSIVGTLVAHSLVITPHYWIEVGTFRVDFRARSWLGNDPNIPDGVFPLVGDFLTQYAGIEVQIEPLEPWLFNILCQPIPATLTESIKFSSDLR